MPKTILLLEHDEDDRYITEALFAELNIDVKLMVATSEPDFFRLLNGNVQPDLILLNYNSGPEGAPRLISILKREARYRTIPIIVGCGLANDDIIRESYAAGASGFIKKAASTRDMHRSIKQVVGYWFDCVMLPEPA